MQSQPFPSSQNCDSTLDMAELTAFEDWQFFNLFIFSSNISGLPLFLLYKNRETSGFTHWSGTLNKTDPNIFFAIIREFITQNRGLLQTQNLKYLTAESADPSAIDSIMLEENLTGPIRPQTNFTTAINDICGLLCKSPYLFQDKTGTMTYFIEMPLLSLEAINQIAQAKGLAFTMAYYTLDGIKQGNNEEICTKLKKCLDNFKMMAYIQKFIVEGQPIDIKESYAIMSCEPKFDNFVMHSLHYPIYKKHGEKWDFYRAHKGEFPTDEELKRFKGVIIPGSSCSAYMDLHWFKELFERISKIVQELPQINFLLICFGAQVTSQALGGRVEKMARPFHRGEDKLIIKPDFYEHEYVRKAGVDPTKTLFIAQSHGDHIVQLPAKAVCVGSSETTNVEIYTMGSNILAFQGHPEYTEAWTAGSYYWVKKLQVENYDKYAEEYMTNTFPSPLTNNDIQKICFTFLKKDERY